MKKQLEISAADPLSELSTMQEWSGYMDQYERHLINNAPWPAFSYTPMVSFSMTHTQDAILLKYYVQEEHVRATAVHPNDLVYKDSCVEFFISFDNGASYYNLEFNCIGTCYAGFGYKDIERSSLPVEFVKTISYHAELQQSASHPGLTEWSLTLKIPFTLFINDAVGPMTGKRISANFYKCGDELPSPHYLTWNNIVSEKPNFHMPEYFGELLFL